MEYTLERLKKMMDEKGGSLDLSGTAITTLPEGLTVGGWLDLSGTAITTLPESLTVGGSLDLSGTAITTLPEGLTVGSSLDLSGTAITTLPEGLTVGGSLYLSGTAITTLPEGLTVGGSLDLSFTAITTPYKMRNLANGDYEPGRWLYADGILTHITRKKEIAGGYFYYAGKIRGHDVIQYGDIYAHCKNFRQGMADISFKLAKNRGSDQYKGLALDHELSLEEAITMYRIITGACSAGCEQFAASLGVDLKDHYTIAEMIEVTKSAYGGHTFAKFWEAK
jgi:hypothetical protein